jgi:hypothetical protein
METSRRVREMSRWLQIMLRNGHRNGGDVVAADVSSFSKPVQDQTRHICFLCRRPSASRDALTSHCKRMHVAKAV